jgi:hypothetical protein
LSSCRRACRTPALEEAADGAGGVADPGLERRADLAHGAVEAGQALGVLRGRAQQQHRDAEQDHGEQGVADAAIRGHTRARGLRERDLPEQIELVEDGAGAEDDRELGLVAQEHREAGLVGQEHVQVAQLGAAAGEDDALVDDVGAQLGRGALEHEADGVDDRVIGSLRASRISSESTTIVFGMPATRSRPLTSIVMIVRIGAAVPIWILMRSAVRSPIRRLYLRLTC